jgi:hypothetical protein
MISNRYCQKIRSVSLAWPDPTPEYSIYVDDRESKYYKQDRSSYILETSTY